MKSAVLQLCKQAMKQMTRELCQDWLAVLPLCHFITCSCNPFSSLEYDPEKVRFNARAIEYGYDGFQRKGISGYVCTTCNDVYMSTLPT